MKFILSLILLIFNFFTFYNSCNAQQSNFNILPSPIPFPSFVPDQYSGKIDGSFINITADQVALSGGLADLKGRYAINEYFGFDGEVGMGGLQGTMPGIAPLSLTPGYFYRIDGTGQTSMFMFRMSINFEIQLFHTNNFSLIVFGGPTFLINNTTISTPYSIIVSPGFSNAGRVFTGFTNKLSVYSSMSGGQYGAQIDLYSPEIGIRISPFFLVSSFSGTATITDEPGNTGASTTTLSAQIPNSTSSVFGFDIYIGKYSIGSALQQLRSQQQTNGNTNIFMITLGYAFSNDDEQNKTK
ncbi:hypothetical protein [Fluviispira multicolorata]|uniref:Outer membrane protein beta-barrel domain-containing protein n=1 Tax=Fluviispira multicolorata TaxID=2654512 RepID=A0A833JC08_9BACT|nr:hypothetical protein [Fluviispira multicolorata]KAB8029707.1 hypothetical protein GCL57_09180 [Fluviispira multicolorata]